MNVYDGDVTNLTLKISLFSVTPLQNMREASERITKTLDSFFVFTRAGLAA